MIGLRAQNMLTIRRGSMFTWLGGGEGRGGGNLHDHFMGNRIFHLDNE